MTIDAVWQIECDGCMAVAFQDDLSATKAEAWQSLKESGWKRRKELTWCPHCVEHGIFKAKYVSWQRES